MSPNFQALLTWSLFGLAAATTLTAHAGDFPAIGKVHVKSERLHQLLTEDAVIEQLTDDVFDWSEGPVWVPEGDYLLFSDVPANTMYKWSGAGGLEVFRKPSSMPGDWVRDESGQGTNGLLLSLEGRLLAADHGARAVVATDLASGIQQILTREFEGRRYNSPNDLAISRTRWPGALFFTDPPYGLAGQDDSPLKELEHNGIYRLDTDGKVSLLDVSLARPNGLALSPDERKLYVANSNKNNVIWKVFNLESDANTDAGAVFFSAQEQTDAGAAGLPDGMAVDVDGNVWATGPGGVYVISAEGELLGVISTGTAIANCAFGGADGSQLFMTSDGFLARIQTRTQGLEFR